MRRPIRTQFRQVLAPTLVAALVVPSSAAEAVSVWPHPPADPVVQLDSELSKLGRFEVAVQGPTDGSLKQIQKLKRPSGIAFDSRDRLLVSDSRQGVLLQIDPDLGVVLVLGSGTDPTLQEPRGVAVHPDGTIYVADAGLRRVVAFDRQGEVSAVFGDDSLAEPVDVAVSPAADQLYVVDSKSNHLAIFDVTSRRQVETFGERGVGVGEFILPTAVEFDRAGNLMVVDQLNGRVQIFDPAGAFTRALHFDRFSRPYDIATDSLGKVYVSDSAQSLIQVYDPDLEPVLAVGRNGLRHGEFLGIGGLAVRGDRLAALDRAGGRVQIFQLHGVEDRPVGAPQASSTWTEPPPAVAEEISAPLEASQLEEPEVEAPVREITVALPPPATEEPLEAVAEEPQVPAAPDETAIARELLEAVNGWAAAWAAQDVERYLAFYARTFQPTDGSSRDDWAAVRRSRLTAPSSIEVEIGKAETSIEAGAVEVTFLQSYRSDRFSDRVRKQLRLVLEDGAWKIERETVLETL